MGSWLNWNVRESEALGIGADIHWALAFRLRSVIVHLQMFPGPAGTTKRILDFMHKTPVDRRRPDRFEIRSAGHGYRHLYSHQLVGDDVLSGKSTAAVTEAVREAVKDFLDSEDSDYKRVGNYFRCLAFGKDVAAEEGEDAA